MNKPKPGKHFVGFYFDNSTNKKVNRLSKTIKMPKSELVDLLIRQGLDKIKTNF